MFSELTEAGLSDPYKSHSLAGNVLPLYVHINALREFKTGTLWRDGRRIQSSPIIDDRFRISTASASIYPLGYRAKVGNHWIDSIIPENYFHLESNRQRLASSRYALIPVVDNPRTSWIVIPCSEILRFYFGQSSRLLGKTVQGRLDDLISWEKSRMDMSSAVLHVRRPINRKEAATLARALANSKSKTELFGIHQRLAKTQANNSSKSGSNKLPLAIEANFPFDDDTELAVAGKRIQLYEARSPNEKNQWAVFVMEILHCSRPFDFSSVVLETDELAFSPQHKSGPGSSRLPQSAPLLDDDEIEVNDRPADARIKRLSVLTFSNQFGGFNRLTFERRYLTKGEWANKPQNNSTVPIDGATFGDGTYSDEGKGNLGIGEYQNRIEQVARELSLFLEMVEHLRAATRDRQWQITTPRLLDSITQGTNTLSQFPIALGPRRTWHLLIEPSGNVRPRQVAVVAVTAADQKRRFYLLEMELRPEEISGQCTILLHLDNFGILDDELFKDLLFLTAVKHRWPDKGDEWKNAQDSGKARSLFSRVVLYRFRHLPSPQKKKGETSCKIDLPAWSTGLLNNIDTVLGGFD